MPLPNVASGRTAQCRARSKRSLRRCLNPAAFGCKTCRFHGARRPQSSEVLNIPVSGMAVKLSSVAKSA
jgi:hypothetical protein